jgi:uncharacterized protein YndB with AHSA1/START domain
MATNPLEFKGAIRIEAPPERVMDAFFRQADLGVWWEVKRSITMPRVLGTYAVEWDPAEHVDRVLGRLGGTFHGTVMEYTPGEELFVADLYWHPPEDEPLGPMALQIRLRPIPPAQPGGDGPQVATELVLRQSADEEGIRWRRYFAITSAGWQRALETLKDYLENEWLYRVQDIKRGGSGGSSPPPA